MEINKESALFSNILRRIVQKTFTLEPVLQLRQKLLTEVQSQEQAAPQQQQNISIDNMHSQQKEQVQQNNNAAQRIEEKATQMTQIIPSVNQEQASIEPQANNYKIVTQQYKPVSAQQIPVKHQQIEQKQPNQQTIDVHEVQITQPVFIQNSSSSKNINQLKQPPFLSSHKNYSQQSSEKEKSKVKDAKEKFKKLSSQQDSINLDIAQKMRKSNNMTSTYGKVDSLMYSDATMMYSNSNATGFGQQISQSNKNSHKKQFSLKAQLNKIEDQGQNIQLSARMQRAESRQLARLRTDSQNKTDLQINLKTQQDQNIFQTQVYDKKRISRIKELKESKKKQLQKELKKVNQQLEELTRKQTQARSNPKPNNYQSRVKISDNVEAKVKAEKLIKNLRYQKKSRHEAHLDELQVLDKNINQYMEEIVKERYKNEDRIKQKKKLEIIQRMKKQQLRKIQQQKKKDKNLQFLHQIKNSGSNNHLIPIKAAQHKQVRQVENYIRQKNQQVHHVPTKERSHTKKSQSIIDQSEMTPELSRKKAIMRKLRNLSLKKQQKKQDLYEQVLG